MQPLGGMLVVDFTWYLPGPFASRELARLGARVVRVEPPEGDPMRPTAPAWHDAVNAGKESVVCDLKTEAGLALANALCARADVVLDGFRPGVLERLGVRGPGHGGALLGDRVRRRQPPRAARRPRRQLPRLGRACSPTPRPALPPTQVADLAAGGLSAALEVVARAARARAHRPRRPPRRLDDARLAPARRAPARRPCRSGCSPAGSPATGCTRPPTAAG